MSGFRFVVDREECLQQKVKEHERVAGSFVVFDYDSPWRDSGTFIDLDVSTKLHFRIRVPKIYITSKSYSICRIS